VMYFNGSYTQKGTWAGAVLIPPEGDILKYAIQLEFPAINNIVEYKGTSHRSSASQRSRHFVTPHQGRFTAGSKISVERV
jgi:hypothetical protein